MERRSFLSMLAASTLAANASIKRLRAQPAVDEKSNREYYELRRYRFQSGPQVELANAFFRDALIPALNRAGINPVGAFTITVGPESPSVFLLMPSASLDALVTSGSRLDSDAQYLKGGEKFLSAPAIAPAYLRVESSLLLAFEGMPKLSVPSEPPEKRPRMFELRIYESPSDEAHKRKVEQFNAGEIESFGKAGFWRVFYAASLIGSRLPSLTYMLAFNDLADRDKKWAAFRSEPGWVKLRAMPRYSSEAIVSNTTNVVLTATPYSQI